jgi:hypothetical protein
MQLFHTPVFYLSQLNAKEKLRTERTEDTDYDGEKRMGKQELSDCHANTRAENGKQPIDGGGYIDLPHQPPTILPQPRKPCKSRLPAQLHFSGLFTTPLFFGYLLVKAADKKNCRVQAQEHGKIGQINYQGICASFSFTLGNRR